MPSPKRDTSASDAENARSLRAHRLRNSLLKQTPDEYDLQHKLEMRRLARKDEEAAARRAEREAEHKDPTFENDTISKRKDLQKKRMTEEAEREAMARAKEEAAIALLKAAKLNEERIRKVKGFSGVSGTQAIGIGAAWRCSIISPKERRSPASGSAGGARASG